MDECSAAQLLKHKKEVKKNLAKQYSFSHKQPLLGIFLDNELTENIEKNVQLFLESVSVLDVEVIVLADSNLNTLSLPNVIYLPYNRSSRKILLEAVDMALVFGFSDVEEMMLNGIIPISAARDEISNYNPTRETGNSFIYKEENPWCIFEALVRARETFKFPYDWKHIVRQGMKSVKG
jgi:hypothetical protein